MSAMHSVTSLQRLVGREIGVSAWVAVGQPMIDAFAAVTDDRQFIHVDPVRAAASSFGTTIAHGFLTLSLLSRFGEDCFPKVEGQTLSLNYGFDKIRFLSPVPSGSRVRGRFVLKEVTMRDAQTLRSLYEVTVEIENVAKPALVAEWLTLTVLS